MNDEKVVNFPNKKSEEEVNVLKASLDAITEAMPELQGMEGMAALLSMPDEEFAIIAPPILMEIEKSLNNVNDKLILTQALNAGGMKAEDLLMAFSDVAYQIDEKMTSIPRPKKEFVKRVLGTLCNAIADTEGIAKKIIQIPIELCHKDAKIPTYAHSTDSGLDIFALEDINMYKECKLHKVKYYWAYPITSFYELEGIVALGVCQILIGAPLFFDLFRVQSFGKDIRVVANNCFDNYIPRENGICGVYIRPEDVQ